MSDEIEETGQGIQCEELTPQERQKWEDTMSLMTWMAPGFRHIFYKLLTNNSGSYGALISRKVPVAATDGKNILINPDTFFKYELKERVFIVAHEVVHNVFDDVSLLHRCAQSQKVPMNDGTELPFVADTMQLAMDYRINALLADSRIGTCPKGACFDKKIGTAEDSVLDIYKKLHEDNNGSGGGSGFDIVMAPNASTGQKPGSSPRNNQQWGVEVAVANTLEQMKSQGKMSGALQRMFQNILQPEVPWTEHIRGIFNRKVGSGSYNWRKPDRRFITRDLHMPSRSGHGAGWIVVWGDTSGSIGQAELASYIAELSSIIDDVRPRRLTVIWCDAEIKRIDEIEEPSDLARIQYEGAPGGGGTDVHPVFDWIAQQTELPDMFIGFTDGYVDIPPEPPFSAIWASTTDKDYPWGERVRINKAGAH